MTAQCAPCTGALSPRLRPRLLFPTFSWAFVPIDPMNVPTKFEVRIALPVPEIREVAKLETSNVDEGDAIGGRGWYRSKERW